MTAKKTPEDTETVTQKQSEAVVNDNQEFDLKSAYENLLAMQDEIRAQAKARGIVLEEPPADLVVAYKDSGPVKGEAKPGSSIEGENNWRPWTKADLDANPDEKYSFVPQVIPGLVHPLLDENRRARIILDINDLKCCLTCNMLNENISGMFYHAYKNAEDAYFEMERFKQQGPSSGPHVRGGPQGINTWHYEPEVPAAWIDLEGAYYKPGAPMPGQASDE